MHLLSVIMLGIAANLDNLGVGLAYGIRKIKVPFGSNLIIAILSGVTTVLSVFAGHLLSRFLPDKLGNLLGGGIVCCVGIWSIVSFYRDKNKNKILPCQDKKAPLEDLKRVVKEPVSADLDYSGHISIKEAVLLGIALAINCLATGLGAGMTGLNVIAMTISVMAFSLFTIFIGDYTGECYVSSYFGGYASLAAGVLLMVIGIYEMFV